MPISITPLTPQPSSPQTRAPKRGWRGRRTALPLCGLALVLLLSACRVSGATGGTASPTSTSGPLPTPTTPALALATQAPSGDVAQLCAGAFNGYRGAVYTFGQNIYAEPAFALSYPSYTLPTGTPQKPFDVGASLNGSNLDQVFGGAANANPAVSNRGGIDLTICNNGSSAITLSALGVGLLTVAPHASPIDTWQLCEGAYQSGHPSGGGCGGASPDDLYLHADFAASATTGATASAAMVAVDNFGGSSYTALPTTIQPGKTILITISVTMPTAPATYTLGLTLTATGVSTPAYAPLDPQLFAPVSHKWNGQNCVGSSMSSQIPSSSSDYWVCPG